MAAAALSGAKPDKDGYVIINGRRVRTISTKGMTFTKSKATAATEVPEIEEIKPVKPAKSRLNAKDLAHFRNLLLLKRAELAGDLTAIQAEALQSRGDLSTVPIHMADIGTDTYDQDFMLNLADAERKLIREIDAALQRIEDGTYGVCSMTNKPIPKARLNAKPWAQYTIEAARELERGAGV